MNCETFNSFHYVPLLMESKGRVVHGIFEGI